METKQYKSQKQIDNEIQEELKQLRKVNSQLLEQNRELVEALRGLPELLIEASDFVEMIEPPRNGSSAHSPKLLSKAKFIKVILTKHSKDENSN